MEKVIYSFLKEDRYWFPVIVGWFSTVKLTQNAQVDYRNPS